jgi:hypothetical protein
MPEPARVRTESMEHSEMQRALVSETWSGGAPGMGRGTGEEGRSREGGGHCSVRRWSASFSVLLFLCNAVPFITLELGARS